MGVFWFLVDIFEDDDGEEVVSVVSEVFSGGEMCVLYDENVILYLSEFIDFDVSDIVGRKIAFIVVFVFLELMLSVRLFELMSVW